MDGQDWTGVAVIQFARESLTAALINEMMPLLREHWKEVAHFADIPLDVDVDAYLTAEAFGQVRCFTARDRTPGSDWTREDVAPLVGYAVYFVRPNPHYRGSVQAVQDVLYLHPSVRGGTGFRFIAYCDAQLRAEGVQAVYQHVKVAHDFGKLLARQGYEMVDTIWAKRLDAPPALDPATYRVMRDPSASSPFVGAYHDEDGG